MKPNDYQLEQIGIALINELFKRGHVDHLEGETDIVEELNLVLGKIAFKEVEEIIETNALSLYLKYLPKSNETD